MLLDPHSLRVLSRVLCGPQQVLIYSSAASCLWLPDTVKSSAVDQTPEAAAGPDDLCSRRHRSPAKRKRLPRMSFSNPFITTWAVTGYVKKRLAPDDFSLTIKIVSLQ